MCCYSQKWQKASPLHSLTVQEIITIFHIIREIIRLIIIQCGSLGNASGGQENTLSFGVTLLGFSD